MKLEIRLLYQREELGGIYSLDRTKRNEENKKRFIAIPFELLIPSNAFSFLDL